MQHAPTWVQQCERGCSMRVSVDGGAACVLKVHMRTQLQCIRSCICVLHRCSVHAAQLHMRAAQVQCTQLHMRTAQVCVGTARTALGMCDEIVEVLGMMLRAGSPEETWSSHYL